MSKERVDPILGFTMEGKGWDGDQFMRSGEPAYVEIDPEDARQMVELLRAHTAKRLELFTAQASLLVAEWDFTSPTTPTREALVTLVERFDACSEMAAVLREMAPEEFDDDDHEEEPDPDPVPSEEQPSDA